MNTSIKQHEMKAQWVEDEHGPAVMLTQSDDGYCEPQTVLVHPWQLRAACEHLGILPTGDLQARRTIATLTRRILTLSERASEVREYVAKYSDHEHADLQVEMVMLNALADLAEEWATEAEEARASAGAPEQAQEAPKPGAGGADAASQGQAPARGKQTPAAQPALI